MSAARAMRVLVTGATGFVGSHAVAALLAAGHAVTAHVRDASRVPSLLRGRVAVVEGPLEALDPRGHDAVIHNAIVWRDADDERGLDDQHVAEAVFRAAVDVGVEAVIYTSSTAVHRPFTRGMDESQRLAPSDDYGRTKAANERSLARVTDGTETRAVVLRPGPVVGGPAVEGARVKPFAPLAEVVRRACDGEEIEVTRGEGRQFVAAEDLARAFVRAVESPRARGAYLVVARELVSWELVARVAVERSGSASRVRVVDGDGSCEHGFDVSRLERDLGLRCTARRAVEDEVARLVARLRGD
ncbi:MAG: NAD(P)-dependent oxidoreductase [Polyangiales bacterium]